MGLIYLFPVEQNEQENDERIFVKNGTLTLKTYGLPMIFWGYLAAILVVVAAMGLASFGPLKKMLSYDDPILHVLAYLVIFILTMGPVILISFYFYEKFLIKKENTLTIIHRLFFIPIIKKTITLDNPAAFHVDHFLESPNLAKMQNREELRGFENKGYFQAFALSQGKKIYLDRSSRKIDLMKMIDLLSQY